MSKLTKFTDLEKFIIDFPNKPWDFEKLSSNDQITWEFIKTYPELGWYFGGLFRNKNITFEIVRDNSWFFQGLWRISDEFEITWQDVVNNPQMNWDYSELIKHKCVTWDIVLAHPEIFDNDAKYLFMFNVHATLDIISKNDNIWDPDDFGEFIQLDHCTFKMIKECFNPLPRGEEFTWIVSTKKDVTPEDIMTYSDFPWDYNELSTNPNLTCKFIKENLNKPWNYKKLSRNNCFTMKDIEENPEIPWDYSEISRNHNLTLEFIERYIDKPWVYNILSANWCITWGFVKKYRDKPWNFSLMTKNPSITWDIIEKNPYVGWNYKSIVENPSIPIKIIRKHFSSNKDIYWNLSKTSEKKKRFEIYNRQRAARTIQNACTNWLIKPITSDGKLGINFRIAAKYMYGLEAVPLYEKDLSHLL